MTADALIVGGGLAGLACATALSERGLRVVVVEATGSLGGRAGSCTDPTTGDVVDVGPHVVLSEYPNLLRFLDLLGSRDGIVWDDDQMLKLVDGGQVARIHSSLLPTPFQLLPSLLRVPGLPIRDLMSNHRVSWFAIRASEQDLLEVDDVDALTFLRRMKASQRLIDWFWASASMTIMNVPLDRCSAGALLRFYRILVANRDLRFGFPTAGLAELFADQAARQIEAAGGRVLLKVPVARLSLKDGAVTGAMLADGAHLEGRVCVCAVPPAELAAMLPCEVDWPPMRNLRDFQPSPYVSTYIWFDRKLSRERNWARTWSAEKLNYDFYDLSNIRPQWADRPSVIAGNIIYSHRAEHLSDDEIIGATVREMAEFLPEARSAGVRHARVHRVPMAIPCPHPGMERKRPPSATTVAGMVLAGDWTATGLPCSMESAVRSGWLAAEEVLKQAGSPERIALTVRKSRGLLALNALQR